MPEDTVKRIAVTFGTGRPHGVHAVFKHDGQWWIAYPAARNARIWTVIDRMIGIYARITEDMVRWINIWPDDADRCVAVMNHVDRGRKLKEELIGEKARL